MARIFDDTRLEVADVTADRDIPNDAETPATAGWDAEGWPKAALFLEAENETDTCTVRAWFWNGQAWCKGASAEVSGSTVVTIDTLGSRIYTRLTSVSGTFNIRYRRMVLED